MGLRQDIAKCCSQCVHELGHPKGSITTAFTAPSNAFAHEINSGKLATQMGSVTGASTAADRTVVQATAATSPVITLMATLQDLTALSQQLSARTALANTAHNMWSVCCHRHSTRMGAGVCACWQQCVCRTYVHMYVPQPALRQLPGLLFCVGASVPTA